MTATSAGAMRALQYRLSVPGYLAARVAGRWLPGLPVSGLISGLRYTAVERPALPGPDWVRVRPLLSGICASDLSLLAGRNSPALAPFASFPAVLGHETLGQIVEVGAEVSDLGTGERVVIDPVISCDVRGLPACASCARGQASLCLRPAEGPLAPGMIMGYCRDLPGGWSEEMVAHRTQIYRVPATLSDATAVLVEPLSVGLHAVLKLPPGQGSRVLVIGAGTIGLCVLAALRLLRTPGHVTVVARHPFQAHLASRLGADEVVRDTRRGHAAGEAATRIAGAQQHQPPLGPPVYTGGFDQVYDCAGSARSLDDSLRVAGPQGRVVVVGCPGEIRQLDWSFIWARELHVLGSYVYACETAIEGAPHTFEVAMRLLESQPEYPLAELVTHRFPLSAWRTALQASRRRAGGVGMTGAVKVVFDPRAELPPRR